MGAYSFFIGWAVIIALFWGAAKFEGTRTITYYALWLAVVLVIVTHYNDLRGLISAAIPGNTEVASGAQ